MLKAGLRKRLRVSRCASRVYTSIASVERMPYVGLIQHLYIALITIVYTFSRKGEDHFVCRFHMVNVLQLSLTETLTLATELDTIYP